MLGETQYLCHNEVGKRKRIRSTVELLDLQIRYSEEFSSAPKMNATDSCFSPLRCRNIVFFIHQKYTWLQARRNLNLHLKFHASMKKYGLQSFYMRTDGQKNENWGAFGRRSPCAAFFTLDQEWLNILMNVGKTNFFSWLFKEIQQGHWIIKEKPQSWQSG